MESAAAEWLVRQDRGLTAAQQDAFLQWLASCPAHRESFERHRGMWRDFNALGQWRPEHSAEPNPDLLARLKRPRWHRWAAPVALAAAAAVAVLVWRAPELAATGAAVQTLAFEAADYRQETLPDGSVLDLNRGAHAVVQFSRAERRVLLVRGEAQFTVAKNPARPFVVRAGGVDVRAIGTAFNVKLAGSSLEVLVTAGKVQVERQAFPAPDPAGSTPAVSPAPAVLAALTAGHRTVIPVATEAPAVAPVVQPASPAEMARVLDWKPRLLDFESVPLAEVAETFNRRNRTQLIVGDPALASLPIVASIRSDNVAGFVRLLEATMGVRAERTAAGAIILHRAR